jgi:hypothetical protein
LLNDVEGSYIAAAAISLMYQWFIVNSLTERLQPVPVSMFNADSIAWGKKRRQRVR